MIRLAVLLLLVAQPAVVLAQQPPDPEEEEKPIEHDDNPAEEEDPIPDVSQHADAPTDALPEGEDESTMQGAWDPSARPAPDLQSHEIHASFDVLVANRANAGIARGEYTWTPGGIDRHDPAVAAVRRFTAAESWIRAIVLRHGHSLETHTVVAAEGAWRPTGRLVATLHVGMDLDSTRYDVHEAGYWALPMQVSLGGRPLPRLELAAVAGYRPVLDSVGNDAFADPTKRAYRSGHDRELGGRVTWASGGDRLYVDLLVLHRTADWELRNFNPGPLGFSGIDLAGDLRVQVTQRTTLGLSGRMTQMHWTNERMGDEDAQFVGEQTERDVLGFEGDVVYVYWFEGRTGFRFSFGGGFQGEPPIFYDEQGNGGDRGFFRFGGGVISRF